MTAAARSRQICPGDVLAGRYRVLRVAGSGGRKQVHVAHDEWLSRDVAVCSLQPDCGEGEAARLRREAAVLARLGDHPSVVAVHDLLEVDGTPVMICRYLGGGSLQEQCEGVSYELGAAVSLVADVAAALSRAHHVGLVHRDVKPANIWLDDLGRGVLGDFGLAVEEGVEQPYDLLVGSQAYIAPEQLIGGRSDARSDLYSLGCVLFQLLTGRPPFVETSVLGTAAKVLQEEPPSLSSLRADLPAGLDDLVRSLLAKDPEQRPASAEELLRGLHRFAEPPATQGAGAATRTGFVGRSGELAQLQEALAAAAAGRGGLTLLLGEPGIGKTRLALELAHSAAAQGWTVLTGRCHDTDGAPAFWPWTQVLRGAIPEMSEDQSAGLLRTPLLSALLPELPGAPAPLDPDSSRFLLFDAVADLLVRLGAGQPVVVLLDDGHWMDPASRALTEHVARELTTARVAVVVCARDVDDKGDPDEVLAVAGLAGTAGRTVALSGLSRQETNDFIEGALQIKPDATLLGELHDRTEGNPFYLAELVRLLQSEHRITDQGGLRPGAQIVPTSVREVLRRRLRHVSAECAQLLRTMSVVGREAPVAVLCRVSGKNEAEVLALLDEGLDARLVQHLPSHSAGFRFAHALVRDSLYDELSTVERAALHRRTMDALVEVPGREREAPAVEMAHHAVRALVDGDAVPAVLWSVRAARAAASAAAHEDAVLHYGRAVELATSTQLPVGVADVPPFGELLLELGNAQRRLGQSEQARATFQRVVDEALAGDDAELLARGALGYGLGLGGFGFVGRADGVLLALLEEAAAALGPHDSPLRMRVLARLATELYFTPFRSRRLLLSSQALEMAQRLGAADGELLALYSRTLASLGPEQLAERRRTADRVIALATALGDGDMTFRGHQLRLMGLLESGHLEQARADVLACRRLADLHREPAHEWQAEVFEAMLLLAAGQFDDALRMSHQALRSGRRGSAEIAQVMHGAQLLVVHWARGRLEDVVDGARAFADQYPHAPAWRAAFAFTCTEIGRLDEAREQLEVLAARDFADLPEDGNFLTTAGLLAHVAARVGDVERARQLEAKLQPFADRHIVLAAGAAAFTSVRLALGVLRSACGDLDAAVRDVTAAHLLHRRARTPAYVVWSGEELVRLLLARGAHDDPATARAVLDEALPIARELGMRSHLRRLTELSARAGGAATAAAVAEAESVTILISDVAGSTELTEARGERAVHVLLSDHHRFVAEAAGAEGGILLKVIGDAVVLAFPSADGALRCAAAVQRHYEQVDRSPVRVRIGVHTGPVLRQGDSMYGRTMILAFRVADRARAGEVLVSSNARAAAGAALDFAGAELLSLKGIAEPQQVHRLQWREHRGQD